MRKLLIDNKRISGDDRLAEWDLETAGGLRRREIYEQHGDLSRFLTLRALISGVTELCTALYDVNIEVLTPDASEIWAGHVIRLVCAI